MEFIKASECHFYQRLAGQLAEPLHKPHGQSVGSSLNLQICKRKVYELYGSKLLLGIIRQGGYVVFFVVNFNSWHLGSFHEKTPPPLEGWGLVN